MKSYCTQNNGDCSTCSLVNYGLDCANMPLKSPRHTGTRESRMLAAYTGHHGPVTIAAVLEQIPAGLQKQLTGKQLGMVMSCINNAYHNGKAVCGCEIIDGDAIWINALDALVELDDIRKLVTSK